MRARLEIEGGVRPLAPVTVIVPAFNAEQTLAETLRSIGAQTHPSWNCVIVDDGSTDQTAAIAREFCLSDRRFMLLRKSNGGVASARNLGLLHAEAAYVAPIDADDVWHPDYLACLSRRAAEGNGTLGFVYAYSRRIDAQSRVIDTRLNHALSGHAALALLYLGCVGNGSAALMSRSAALEAGGFDETLRAQGAEGCEDWLLLLRIALRHPIAAVPRYLVGYRRTQGSMSSDVRQMYLSWKLAAARFLDEVRNPRIAVQVIGLARSVGGLARARQAMRQGARWPLVAKLVLSAVRGDPKRSLCAAADLAQSALTGRLRKSDRGRAKFSHYDPDAPPDQAPGLFRRLLWKIEDARLQEFLQTDLAASGASEGHSTAMIPASEASAL